MSALMWGALCGAALAQHGGDLSDGRLEGQRLFTQHCGVCHLRMLINAPSPNGPTLTDALFANNQEAQVSARISDGSPNMPGFKLMFGSAQIDSIVDYLKTISPPATNAPTKR